MNINVTLYSDVGALALNYVMMLHSSKVVQKSPMVIFGEMGQFEYVKTKSVDTLSTFVSDINIAYLFCTINQITIWAFWAIED